MEKRGQITVFIIIGIVLLISIGTLVYIYVQKTSSDDMQIIPEKVVPISNYVTNCLYSTAKEAVVYLGMQGGYVTLPDSIAKDSEAHLAVDSRGLSKIAYWSSVKGSNVPTLESMQDGINEYVKNNIRTCLDNFSTFTQFSIAAEEPEVKTTIAEDDVVVSMDMLVLIGTGTERYTLDKFRTSLPVKLKRIHRYAINVMKSENEMMWFENITLDLMAMDSKIPFTGMEFHCGPKQWLLSDVKESIQDSLDSAIPVVRFSDTNYTPFLEDEYVYESYRQYTIEDISEGNHPPGGLPEDAYEYNHLFLDAADESFTDLRAAAYYDRNWKFVLDSRPSVNGVMKSSMMKGIKRYLSYLCLNLYHFTYDVNYPIMIMIRDDSAFGNEGYIFRFAFPVIINHNEPGRTTDLNIFEVSQEDDARLCLSKGDDMYYLTVTGIREGYSGMELSGANITYDCYKFQCYLGETGGSSTGYYLNTTLPDACANGFLVAEKEGYLGNKTQVLDQQNIQIPLQTLKKLKVDVVKHDSRDYSKTSALSDHDEVIVDLESLGGEHTVYLVYNKTSGGNVSIVEEGNTYVANVLLRDSQKDYLIGGFSGNFTYAWQDIATASTIVFHVVDKYPRPIKESEQIDLLTFLQFNESYRQAMNIELK